MAIIAVVALLVLAAEVLLLVFLGLLRAVLLSSLADALVRMSGMGRGKAIGLTVLVLFAATGGDGGRRWGRRCPSRRTNWPRSCPAALRELRGWFEGREWGRWLLGRTEPRQMVDGGDIVNHATGVLLTTINALVAVQQDTPAAPFHI